MECSLQKIDTCQGLTVLTPQQSASKQTRPNFTISAPKPTQHPEDNTLSFINNRFPEASQNTSLNKVIFTSYDNS
jgi:hypothetical protein